MQQVQQHSKESRAWVVYRHGVYDVTEFAGVHPGGDRILQAAGKSVELFWHQSEPHSRAGAPETLEDLRVGNLSEEDFDRMEEMKKTPSTSDAVEKFFFIEGTSTFSAPEVDLNNFNFDLKICGVKEVSLSQAELKTRFKLHSVTTTVRCATSRATAASGDKQTPSSMRVPAEWTGVLLADVLASVGVTIADIEQVRFEALDTDAKGRAFGASIPVETALDREVGVLLAFEMNGGPISKEHGFPLRVVVPGTTGARNVKFVHRIVLTSLRGPSVHIQQSPKDTEQGWREFASLDQES
ncbi:hypothetical protein PF005_g9758 [Phytophthora fragariae]|uniref:Cytochrome b5 heme-binding domain-containing protein n=1 Tax=Phytophthora fragariae TaxID=53985 RepID=A0A6A4A6W7_9STRA|nr:hypothetical protein PF003_g23693 [Phytophthora fragariae]KAE8945954.1 hypothetical protein PF009_g4412 [Phytophthora fragariae]KAE8993707.1 hypothetical protein PF011_g17029 [Phytophthora fragariae]KAE9098829.1 hypothetical protein PF010_g15411 [Phytophthora fragariae]KAE9128763.1 hypothetical protein PF007_g5153 [Phytophthora fragariae]